MADLLIGQGYMSPSSEPKFQPSLARLRLYGAGRPQSRFKSLKGLSTGGSVLSPCLKIKNPGIREDVEVYKSVPFFDSDFGSTTGIQTFEINFHDFPVCVSILKIVWSAPFPT